MKFLFFLLLITLCSCAPPLWMSVVVSGDKCVRGHLRGVASRLYYKGLQDGMTPLDALEYTRQGLYLYQLRMSPAQISRLHNCDCQCDYTITNRRVLKRLERDHSL